MRPAQGLYEPRFEHDACGVGFVANINGEKSHEIIVRGIEILRNLLHRGTTGADATTGDGAGILIQIPDRFFQRECGELGIALPETGAYAVGMFFLPQDESLRKQCVGIVERTAKAEGLTPLGWRNVPLDDAVIGEQARADQPFISQFFAASDDLRGHDFERKLCVVRKVVEKAASRIVDGREEFYIPSFSAQTVVYKGLMLGTQVPGFYKDLQDKATASALAVVHQRYSTNTFPSWSLAQPFRILAHNGEINTLRGNLNWMASREKSFESDLYGADIKKALPALDEGGSDSACLDNALELLTTAGRSLHHSMMMLVPQAWGVKYPMGPDLRGFFEYHAGLMEPWDGPAALVFSDGRHVGAMLDRNGLRPARYTITTDGFMVFASEAGVLDIPPESVVEKGALRPGQMILADIEQNRVRKDVEIKMCLARRQPYRRWVEENKIDIHGFFNAVAPLTPDTGTLLKREKLFGYTREDIKMVLKPMASAGHEPVGSMGADEPLAVLSEKPQLLYGYFKQLFAQITNPAIDSYREELVMSLMTFIGSSDNILTESPRHARLVKLNHPILSNDDLARIRDLNLPKFACRTLAIGFPAGGGGNALALALDQLCQKAEGAAMSGCRILILSDRDLQDSAVPMPALLAVSAVNQYLVGRCLRTRIGIILETGEAREVMHMALLLGYGVSAINPYLAFEILAAAAAQDDLDGSIGVAAAIENYTTALCKGLLKIMSKMGISTLRSYRNARVFEAVGLNSGLIEKYFSGTVSRLEGIGLDEIACEANARHAAAYESADTAPNILSSGGRYSLRKDGERHLWNPETIHQLQQAARTNDYVAYRRYAELINNQERQQSTLRGLFRFKNTESAPLDEVEPATEIVKRFVTGAMSFGSISREAHEALAIAMNRIGGMSNSGEGGEDRERYAVMPNGDSKCSAIKQVASGRFGVTAEYLLNAKDLQIKIAQGAKPGEGGQLPGHKVNEEIASVRHSTPGVTLISPPPHHDIYSIEDIAQLIYDLRNANPEARVSVKLVSEAGVGTVAAGVAKARADVILISGHDGGTGASPLSSIHYAGMPWEVGLSETQQTLVLNGLRSRVRLQTDGQLKTGRDVVIAAMLGAEEFGFATAALVVLGCVMMRSCHKNTCPVGVGTQDPQLRKLFVGRADHVVNFMLMLAEEVREHMAALGIRDMDDLIGRSDLLEMNPAIDFWKARGLDFSKIFHHPPSSSGEARCTLSQDHGLDGALDHKIIPKVKKAIETERPVTVEQPIHNVDRTVGTLVSCEIVRKYGDVGLPDNTINLTFSGSAGQSFGAFCTKGMTLLLEGEANDYLGKGLSGAKIVVRPPDSASFEAAENIIAGNVLLYGATSGEVYINGRVGERFAIRNSGAIAVVEGVGDHGCEYMTGGRVAILGPTGVNFGAGMSGGIAYVFDKTGMFDSKCNLGMLDLELVMRQADQDELRGMIERHVEYTDSRNGRRILDNWDMSLLHFIKVFPMDYKRALGYLSCDDEAVERRTPINH